jgi:hypothetical protein
MTDMTMMEDIIDLWTRLVESDRTSLSVAWKSPYGSIHEDPLREKVSEEQFARALSGERDDEWVVITLAEYSDYGGSDLDHANVRTLRDEYGCDTDCGGGFHGHQRAVIVLGELPESDGMSDRVERLRAIVEAIEGLNDYPVLSDSEWSELQLELADEAWDAWLRSDLIGDLENLLGVDDIEEASVRDEFKGDPRDLDDVIRCAYYEFEDNEWVCEDATSATNYRHKEAMTYVAEKVFGFTS